MSHPYRLIPVSAVLAFFALGEPAAADIAAPKVGLVTKYDCTGPYASWRTYRVVSIQGGMARIDMKSDKNSGWVDKPIATLGTTLAEKRNRNNGKGVYKKSLSKSVLAKYAKLEPGTKLEFNVRERNDNGKWEWGYEIEIGQPQSISHPVLGDINVVPVEESRKIWNGSYASSMTVLLYPEKGITISWKYKDGKGLEDCSLTSME